LITWPEQLFVIKNGRLFKEFKCDEKKLGIRALDPKTLAIELERQDPLFLHKLAQPFFFPLFGSMREPKWFNGPYLIRNQSREGLLLERNPYFWETHRPCFEQIEIQWRNDVNGIYQLFQEGKTDWIGDPLSTLSPPLIQQLQQQGRLKKKKVNRRFLVHFNTQLPYLSSPRIRHALGLAIKRSLICEAIFPHSIPLQHPTFSNAEACDLFEIGLKELRLTKKSFPVLKFSYSHQTGREMLASCLQSHWENKLGINVCVERLEWNLFRNKLEKGEYEVTATIQETLENSPFEFFDRFEGSNSWNFSQWRHTQYRETLNQAHEFQDSQKRGALLKKTENILIEEAPFSPLLRCTHLFAHHEDLKNYLFDAEGCVDFCRAYIQQENPL
jgi:oligopeptide transport system substrate-binding protein